MKELPIEKAFTLIEPGPVLLVTTNDGTKPNVMTISWSMVAEFTPVFVIMTGPWNASFETIIAKKECVLNVPPAAIIEKVIGAGTVSGKDADKFKEFGFTPIPAKKVKAPIIAECLGAVECKVIDYIEKHGLIVLSGVRAVINEDIGDRRMLHAVGDGTFFADGERFDMRSRMENKLPEGV
jgi:Conserved protein/domain typically associated with flavoprotein oxygenases, DIM6/NTAB family